ncbi:putative villin/Gelsolin, ADF-H/Gelsolin-like domain superfamily [Helianthus annuus]|nr:putative villin/Gelsolin, ADF-H/Gelsolin-like domain superfamily [Helianthus annuus]KAJ0632859.1 putative villin/Gelsolin, ADF-H/Gelsolin-like domain superfamily [Helianthus annuus]KAJ0826831.1 putative villin/Gelsolin, ADF-H/Gelsolin-like domain superfamily [Helianthus annuus]
MLILDCHTEIYVWALLEKDVLGECLSVDTPIYVVTEGQEPPFFTRFFGWDASKAN